MNSVSTHGVTAIALRDIHRPRIRNLVRGALAIGIGNESAAERAMESIRRECTPEDAVAVFRIFQESPLADHLWRAAPFPAAPENVDPLPFFRSPHLDVEIVEVALRLARHKEQLAEAIELLGLINASVFEHDFASTDLRLIEYGQRFGSSIFVGLKALSLRHSALAVATGRTSFGATIDPFLSPKRQVVAVSFEDSVDEDRDYLAVRRSYLGFVRNERLFRHDAAIVSDVFSPLGRYGFTEAEKLQAYARWSLIDALAYLQRLRTAYVVQDQTDGIALIDAAIPARVRDAWASAFSSVDVTEFRRLVGRQDQFFEKELLSHLPAWSEFELLWDYRFRLERAIGQRLDGNFPIGTPAAACFTSPRTSVDDLLSSSPGDIDINSVDTRSCGALHRTIALISSVENGTIESIDGEKLSLLLDQTIDVSSLLSKEELNRVFPAKKTDLLYELLRCALINEREGSRVSNHALRRALQKLVKEQFGGDLVALMERLHTENGHVTSHIFYLCSEAFLTELYDLFQEADKVTEAQAGILEWRGLRNDDEDATLRAKSHRLNLKLRKVRGAIDETRIYVDPLRFVEWIQEEFGTELRALAAQADTILADTDQSTSLADPVANAIRPRLRMLKLLDACYHEFCTNKIYGVTAFIGRRIRHGTLHGHLVLEYQPEVQAAIDEFRQTAPKFSASLEAWFQRLDAAVIRMAADRILVHSKEKSKGLIVATLDETEKTKIANLMLHDVVVSMRDNSQLVQSMAIIQDYCWLLFEVDLQKTRKAIEALRREFTIDVDEHRVSDRIDLDRRIGDTIRSLNTTMQRRIDAVISWLTRPSGISPSASVALLFQAVLDEVRLRYPCVRPKLNISGSHDVDLFGHRFHFFYDALYILIDNAHKHGDPNGTLGFEVITRMEDPNFFDMTVKVSSDLPPNNQVGMMNLIEQAMRAEIGDAMVDIKNSGLRKLRGLAEHVTEIAGFRHRYDGDTVIFEIDMRYPRSDLAPVGAA